MKLDNSQKTRLINRFSATFLVWVVLSIMIFINQTSAITVIPNFTESSTAWIGNLGLINDSDFDTFIYCGNPPAACVASRVYNITFTNLIVNASNATFILAINSTGDSEPYTDNPETFTFFNGTGEERIHATDYMLTNANTYKNYSVPLPYNAFTSTLENSLRISFGLFTGANTRIHFFEAYLTYNQDNIPPQINVTNITEGETLIKNINSLFHIFIINNSDNQQIGKLYSQDEGDTKVESPACFYNLNNAASFNRYDCANGINDVNNLPIELGDNTITFLNFDSAGANSSDTIEFYVFGTNFTEESQSYNSTTYEIQTEGFILNITYDSVYYGSSAILNYNNTEYAGVKTGTGNNVLFSASLITPNVAAATDIEFYWTITLTNSSGANYYNSTFNNQTVFNVGIDDCSTYTNEIFNFTLRDEETQDEMDGSVQNSSIEIDLTISNPDDSDYYIRYYNNFTENSNPRICVENLTFGSRIDATISYTADDYVTEYYYLENYILENTTSKLPNNIGLYDLLTDDATSYLLTYQDCNYIVGKDKIIQVWRRYIEDGNYLLVEMTRTDENGQGISHLVSEDIEYKLIVLDEGTIEWETDTFRALCISTPCQISIKQICDVDDFIDYTVEDDFTYTLTLTQATKTVELSYTIPSGASATVALNVTQLDYLMNNTICSETQTGAGGTLSCTVPSTLNNRTYYVEVFKDGEFIEDAYFSLDTNAVDQFGIWGVVLSGFLILTFGLMFIATGWGVVVGAVLGFIVSMVLSLVAFSWTIMIWLAIAGAIIVWKISKKVGAG